MHIPTARLMLGPYRVFYASSLVSWCDERCRIEEMDTIVSDPIQADLKRYSFDSAFDFLAAIGITRSLSIRHHAKSLVSPCPQTSHHDCDEIGNGCHEGRTQEPVWPSRAFELGELGKQNGREGKH